LFVRVTGEEYFYNDETGEATWRRPRITLHKGPMPHENGTSYNSTQLTSPAKVMTTATHDESGQLYDETYDQSYTEGGEYDEHYDVASLGDTSALTEDSKNMCFHVHQDNVDIDIYKVRCIYISLYFTNFTYIFT
jgi:hypothetical protein